MQWIDEMFVDMEQDRATASARRSEKVASVAPAGLSKDPAPGTLKAWEALVFSITSDVNEFNNHKERVGQTPVRIFRRHFQCEVHVSGMQGKSLVLTLDNRDLHVSVHPEFPKQPLAIAIELDGEGRHAWWLLGESIEEPARLSNEQLSEYLLRPVLSSASVHRAP